MFIILKIVNFSFYVEYLVLPCRNLEKRRRNEKKEDFIAKKGKKGSAEFLYKSEMWINAFYALIYVYICIQRYKILYMVHRIVIFILK